MKEITVGLMVFVAVAAFGAARGVLVEHFGWTG